MSYRIFYAAGPGNVIQAHKHWRAGEQDPSQVSITYSSQFEDFCRDIGAEAYMVAWNDKKQFLRDGLFILEHRPKPMPGAAGIAFHVREIVYGLGLLATAVRFRAGTAVIHSGTTQYFAMSLFRLAGIPVVTIMHNCLWPPGFPPSRPARRLIARLDSLFFRWAATATIGVSPECLRQVEQLARGRHRPLYQIRAQYHPDHLANIPAPPPLDRGPFRILFLARLDGNKGALDVLEMARKIEDRAPGRVRWDLCGSGSAFELVQRRHGELGLQSIVTLHGWTLPTD